MYKNLLASMQELQVTVIQLEAPLRATVGITLPLEEALVNKQSNILLLSRELVTSEMLQEAFCPDVINNPLVKDIFDDLKSTGEYAITYDTTMAGPRVRGFGLIKDIVHKSLNTATKLSVYLMVEAKSTQNLIPNQPMVWLENPTTETKGFKYFDMSGLNTILDAYHYHHPIHWEQVVFQPIEYSEALNGPIYEIRQGMRVLGYSNTIHHDLYPMLNKMFG